jgi:hypothetical protein
MTKHLFTITALLLTVSTLWAARMTLSVSPSEASIWVNGQDRGSGSIEIIVKKNKCANIEVRMDGYVTIEQTFCNRGGYPLPRTHHFDLKQDKAFMESVASSYANEEFLIQVKESHSQEDAWKLMSQILLSKFDDMDVMDATSGYMRSDWKLKSYENTAVRSRILVKMAYQDPLTFRVTLESELSDSENVNADDDAAFKSWNRILKSYDQMIQELKNIVGGD